MTDYNITNVVLQIQLPYNIYLLVLFKKLEMLFDNNKNEMYKIKSVKYRTFSLGKTNGKNPFKNALHLEFEIDTKDISCKVFYNGLIHISGIHDYNKITNFLKDFMDTMINYNTQYKIKPQIKDNVVYDGKYIIGKNETGDFELKALKLSDNNFTLMKQNTNTDVILNGNYFYEDVHIKSRKVYNNLFDKSTICELSMPNRKNLPKENSYYIKDSKLISKYKDTVIGEFVYRETIENEILNLPDEITITEVAHYPNNKEFNVQIHNMNVTLNNIQFHHINKNEIVSSLQKRHVQFSYNPDKHQSIACNVYISDNGDVYYHDNPGLTKVKFQIQQNNKITMTCKDKSNILNLYRYLKWLFSEIEKNIKSETPNNQSFIPKSIHELYDLMIWSESHLESEIILKSEIKKFSKVQ